MLSITLGFITDRSSPSPAPTAREYCQRSIERTLSSPNGQSMLGRSLSSRRTIFSLLLLLLPPFALKPINGFKTSNGQSMFGKSVLATDLVQEFHFNLYMYVLIVWIVNSILKRFKLPLHDSGDSILYWNRVVLKLSNLTMISESVPEFKLISKTAEKKIKDAGVL
ncbi:hypothetical protein Ccrd_017095 [Cynara cardunculus var. scolymus]|uniref:Uncharacterized protein n=1 Tax=Cynara cardunculus var. scolymus TaxID=59895 RepID=A0A103Y8Q6_CYNCS|nr:hypothetical protein Ccrd_017095 [Cynara cardunculus var. scolymus]